VCKRTVIKTHKETKKNRDKIEEIGSTDLMSILLN
jgi:hypothetical protein